MKLVDVRRGQGKDGRGMGAEELGRRSGFLGGPGSRSARSRRCGLPWGPGRGRLSRRAGSAGRGRLARGFSPFSALAALLRPLRASGGGRNGRLLGAIGVWRRRFGACSLRFPGVAGRLDPFASRNSTPAASITSRATRSRRSLGASMQPSASMQRRIALAVSSVRVPPATAA